MIRHKKSAGTRIRPQNSIEELQKAISPELAKAIDKLYARFGKFSVPLDELRKAVDEEIGERTLTEELYAMREGR